MKPVLFCILLISAACSKGESKDKSTTPPGDNLVDTAPTEPTEPTEPAEGTDATEGAEATGDSSSTLQALPKDWGTAEVKSYMRKVSKGLGVQCDHCHDTADYASDKIPAKIAARKMIEMTRMLDKDHFGGKDRISCATCHKGKLEP